MTIGLPCGSLHTLTVRIASIAVSALVLPVSAHSAITVFGLVNTGELYASTDTAVTWTIRSTLSVRALKNPCACKW